ncbi:MAG: hypothetical protein NC201_04855 [Prevotella sp.]|nr:hypothetical protein [Bacteroides sp.]MCM1366559.1 hypothetical protein [Prevotella sp.]MCM1436869.1 hypothetical protein [Prevotella sp.]
MRKKATYWGLGLAVAIGLSATAASNWSAVASFGAAIQAVAEGDATTEDPTPEEATTDPSGFIPSPEQDVNTSAKLQQITVTFQKNIKSLNRLIDGVIEVKKDGQLIQTIEPTDIEAVRETTSVYDIVISFAQPWSTPGKYTVSVPKGLVTINDADGSNVKTSNAFTVEYNVVQDFSYTSVPALDAQLQALNAGDKFEITFPEASSIELDRDIVEPDNLEDGARFCWYQSGAKPMVLASTAEIKVEGNKIIATVDKTAWFNCNSATKYAFLYLPAGSLKFTMNGQTFTSPEYKIGKYQTVVLPSSELSISPAGNSKEMFSPEEMREFTVTVNASGMQAPSATVFYCLKSYDPETGKIGSSNLGTYTVAATTTEKSQTLKFTMKAATSTTALLNNPQLWEKGYYVFQIPANALKRVDDALFGSSTAQNVSLTTFLPPFYVDGVSTMAATVTPASGVINPDYGISKVSLVFTSAMEAMDKEIKIYKEGDTSTILYQFAASDSKYVTSYNSDKSFDISFPALKNVEGTYVVDVPEGAFRQKEGSHLLNAAIQNKYEFPAVTEIVPVPADGSYFTPSNPLTYIDLTFPGATSVKLNLKEGETGEFPLYTGAGNGATVTLTSSSNKFTPTVNEDGKSVRLTLKTPLKSATATIQWVNLPGGLITVTKDGKEYTVPNYLYSYKVQNGPMISVVPSGDVTIAQLGTLKVIPPAGYKFSGYGTNSTATCKLFDANVYGKPIASSAQNTFAEYSVQMDEVDDGAGNITKTMHVNADGSVNLIPKDTYNLNAVPSGNYVLQLANSATAAGCFLQVQTSEDASVSYNSPFQIQMTVDNSYGNTTLDLENATKVEVLPDEFVIAAPNGGKISFFEGFVPQFGIKVGTSSTKYMLNPAITEDGKLKLTWAEGEKEKAAKVANGKDIYIGTISGTNINSFVGAGSVLVTGTDGKQMLNEKQTFVINISGPVTDPVYTVEPASGIVKVSEYHNGIENISVAVDSYLPLELGASDLTGMILRDKKVLTTFTTADAEVAKSNEVVLHLNPALEESGDYQVIFPKGFFLIGQLKTPSNEWSVKYTVEGLEALPVVSVTPADETIMNAFTGITLNFDKEIVSAVADGVYYTVMNPLDDSFTPTVGLSLEAVVNPDKKSVLLTFSEADEAMLKEAGKWPVSDPGFYKVSIDKNQIVLTDAEGTMYGNTFVQAQYEVVPETNATFAPSADVYFSELKDMTITFADVAKVEKYDLCWDQVSLTDGTNSYPCAVTVEGNKATVSVSEAITEKGTYTLNVPAHYFKITPAGENAAPYLCQALTHNYVIEAAPRLVRTTPTEGAELNYFSNATLIFSAPVSRNKNCDQAASLKLDGKEVATMTNRNVTYPTYEDDPNSVDFPFYREKNKTAGTYTLTIPAGFFTVKGVPTEEITLTFSVVAPQPYTISPKNHQMISSLPAVTVTFPGATAIEDNHLTANEEGSGAVNILNLGQQASISFTTTIEGNTIVYNTNIEKCAEGQTVVSIPYGAYTLTVGDKKVKNPEIYVTYNTPNVPIPVLGGVKSKDGKYYQDAFATDITMTLPEGDTFDMWLPSNVGALYAVNDDNEIQGNSICQWAYNFDEFGSAKGKQEVTLLNTLDAEMLKTFVVEPGNYCIRFKKGTVMVTTDSYTIDDEDKSTVSTTKVCNTDLFYFFTVVEGMTPESVNSIFGDDVTSFDIYTVDGKIVKINANVDEVSGLEPGIYVINGRTMIIRK